MATVAKDPAIKLFGRTISLPEAQFSDESESVENGSSLMVKADTEECRNEKSGTLDEAASFERCKGECPQTSMHQKITSQATLKSKAHQEGTDGAGEPKPMRRPDKILPCPRCNSSDTKFCYFNNYNVNQPRHFCKSCQRYWTAGGTVRNVPVGAGRRRNKHLASQYRQIIASPDGGPPTVETPDSGNQLLSCEESSSSCTALSPKEMVLKFGPESPYCGSTPNLLSKGQTNRGLYNNGSVQGSSLPASSFGVSVIKNNAPLQQPLYHCAVPAQISAPVGVPGFAKPNISCQFVPAYLNCIPVWVAGSGNVPLSTSNSFVSSPFFNNISGMQVLGKHSRDTTNTANEQITAEGMPALKTLRIQELDEA